MADWTYRCYVDGRRPNLWQRWYDENPEAQGKHDGRFMVLEQQDRWESPSPSWKPLSGDMKGLSEVRFEGKDRRAWRVFGHTNQTAQIFTVLSIGFHKDRKYTPKNVMGLAKHRWKEIENDPKKAQECERPKRKP